MIKVTVELYPFGFADGKKTLGVLRIGNDGERSRRTEGRLGDYKCHFSKCGRLHNKYWKTISVQDFPRQSANVWQLLKRTFAEL